MPYEVPTSKKSKKQNRFEFAHDGETYDVPLMKFVSAGAMEAFEAGKNMTGLILAADDERTRNAVRTMDADQLEGLLEAWQKASGITVGESEASSDS